MSASSKKKLRKEQNAAALTEKQLQEQKEAKKLKAYTTGFLTAIIAIVCIALITICVTTYVNSGIIERNTESVKIGDHTLNAAQFNFYFIDEFQRTYSEWEELYGESASMYIAWEEKFDITKPLNEQKHPSEEGKTYADFFVDLAVDKARETYALYDAAQAAGYTLSDEEKENIDATVQNMEFWGQLYGYSGLKDYVKTVYGKGANEENLREYLTVTGTANAYKAAYKDELTIAAADVEAYNTEHFVDFSSFSYSSLVLLPDDFIEHEDENSHNHTDEEKQAALEKAKEAADDLVATGAATFEDLKKAVTEAGIFDDVLKKVTQHKDILYTKLSPVIGEWLAEEGREAGQLGVIPYTSTSTNEDGEEVEEVVGYYVVLFEGRNDNEVKLVNVRHILAEFKGGTTDSNNEKVYSEDEKAEAKARAEKALKAWTDGEKTEESFAALVKEHSDDDGSVENGGLYENVFPGQMVTAFNDWCFDAERKAGDYEIVETEYGYHVIYFVETTDTTYRNHMIEDILTEEAHEAWCEGLIENTTGTILDPSKLSVDMKAS